MEALFPFDSDDGSRHKGYDALALYPFNRFFDPEKFLELSPFYFYSEATYLPTNFKQT
jgi:hypothetical protein